jgi:hypothetical protein
MPPKSWYRQNMASGITGYLRYPTVESVETHTALFASKGFEETGLFITKDLFNIPFVSADTKMAASVGPQNPDEYDFGASNTVAAETFMQCRTEASQLYDRMTDEGNKEKVRILMGEIVSVPERNRLAEESLGDGLIVRYKNIFDILESDPGVRDAIRVLSGGTNLLQSTNLGMLMEDSENKDEINTTGFGKLRILHFKSLPELSLSWRGPDVLGSVNAIFEEFFAMFLESTKELVGAEADKQIIVAYLTSSERVPSGAELVMSPTPDRAKSTYEKKKKMSPKRSNIDGRGMRGDTRQKKQKDARRENVRDYRSTEPISVSSKLTHHLLLSNDRIFTYIDLNRINLEPHYYKELLRNINSILEPHDGGSKQKRRKKSRKSRRKISKKRPRKTSRKTSRKTLKKRSKRSK